MFTRILKKGRNVIFQKKGILSNTAKKISKSPRRKRRRNFSVVRDATFVAEKQNILRLCWCLRCPLILVKAICTRREVQGSEKGKVMGIVFSADEESRRKTVKITGVRRSVKGPGA
jgi:hypothetical protein